MYGWGQSMLSKTQTLSRTSQSGCGARRGAASGQITSNMQSTVSRMGLSHGRCAKKNAAVPGGERTAAVSLARGGIPSTANLEHLTKRLNRRLWIPMTARIRFNISTGIMETSHEWESLIPTICANVLSLQSMPVTPARKLLKFTHGVEYCWGIHQA